MAQITIRDYQPEDKNKLIALMTEFDGYMQEMDPLKRVRYSPQSAAYFINRMIENTTKKEGVIYIAENDGAIIGFVQGNMEEQSEDATYENIPSIIGRVNELFVTSAYRSTGIGTQLLQKIEAYFKSKKCDYITLQVFAPNTPARKFYEKMGYLERGVNLGKSICN